MPFVRVQPRSLNRWLSWCLLGVLVLACLGSAEAAAGRPKPIAIGNDCYSITRVARFTFFRDTAPLKRSAIEDAEKFCAEQGKRMETISLDENRATLLHGGFSKVTLIFRAVDASTAADKKPESDKST